MGGGVGLGGFTPADGFTLGVRPLLSHHTVFANKSYSKSTHPTSSSTSSPHPPFGGMNPAWRRERLCKDQTLKRARMMGLLIRSAVSKARLLRGFPYILPLCILTRPSTSGFTVWTPPISKPALIHYNISGTAQWRWFFFYPPSVFAGPSFPGILYGGIYPLIMQNKRKFNIQHHKEELTILTAELVHQQSIPAAIQAVGVRDETRP